MAKNPRSRVCQVDRIAPDKAPIFCFAIISAYNGSLISSLTNPELEKRIETNKELLDHADKIAIISIKNTAAPQYMAKSSNIYLKRLQQISDATGRNNATDVTQTIDYVIEHPYTSCFAVAIDFQLRINPPTGDKISNSFETSLETHCTEIGIE